jgi:hypothetical protein
MIGKLAPLNSIVHTHLHALFGPASVNNVNDNAMARVITKKDPSCVFFCAILK